MTLMFRWQVDYMNIFRKISRLCFVCLLSCLCVSVSYSADTSMVDSVVDSSKDKGWLTVYPGFSIKSPTINMKRNSDRHEASVTGSPGILSLDLYLKFSDIDFSDTRWGYTTFSHSSFFTAGDQFAGVDGDDVLIVDLGSSVAGFYSYVVPSIYYRPETTQFEPDLKWGFGVGYGLANFDGSAVFGPDRIVNSNDTPVNVSASASDVIAYVLFYNLEWPNQSNLRVSVTTLVFDTSDYDVELTEFSIIYSQAFSF